MSTAKICPHLARIPDLEVLLVTDATVTLADAFVQCHICEQHYLIELIDMQGPASAFRISALPADAATATLRSLTRGSCDINRASAELTHIRQIAEQLPGVLMRNESDSAQALWHYVADTRHVKIPKEHWRDLPCNGQIIAALKVE
ncbi:MAG: hypothetical protein V2I41_08940 [Pseudomonadales bacterium]|jgi:hypothetical protein|nr:hypothetical protein [Pseudomonadales bacterium]